MILRFNIIYVKVGTVEVSVLVLDSNPIFQKIYFIRTMVKVCNQRLVMFGNFAILH